MSIYMCKYLHTLNTYISEQHATYLRRCYLSRSQIPKRPILPSLHTNIHILNPSFPPHPLIHPHRSLIFLQHNESEPFPLFTSPRHRFVDELSTDSPPLCGGRDEDGAEECEACQVVWWCGRGRGSRRGASFGDGCSRRGRSRSAHRAATGIAILRNAGQPSCNFRIQTRR